MRKYIENKIQASGLKIEPEAIDTILKAVNSFAKAYFDEARTLSYYTYDEKLQNPFTDDIMEFMDNIHIREDVKENARSNYIQEWGLQI